MDWRDLKKRADDAAAAEADAAFARLGIPSAMERFRQEADAQKADEEAETRRRRAEERRDRRERAESATVAELRAEIEALRKLIFESEEKVADTLENGIIPLVEHFGDTLQAAIKQNGARIDRDLEEIREEVRAAIKRERGGEVLDLPPSLRAGRNVN
jgi:hypothetical protein